MKLLERVLGFYIRKMVNINEMHFGFVPGRGTTDAIFVVRRLQGKYIAATKLLYFAFFDLEKALDRVPIESGGPWEAEVSKNGPRVSSSEEFKVWDGVHQGFLLSSLLFILVLGALFASFALAYWRPGAHQEHAGEVHLQAEGMESWHGKYRATCRHEKD